MGTSLMLNIPKGLHAALEGSSARFPLNNALKLTKVLPSFKEAPNSPKCIKYDKIMELMDGKYSKTLYDRHASALEKMARILSLGIVKNIICL